MERKAVRCTISDRRPLTKVFASAPAGYGLCVCALGKLFSFFVVVPSALQIHSSRPPQAVSHTHTLPLYGGVGKLLDEPSRAEPSEPPALALSSIHSSSITDNSAGTFCVFVAYPPQTPYLCSSLHQELVGGGLGVSSAPGNDVEVGVLVDPGGCGRGRDRDQSCCCGLLTCRGIEVCRRRSCGCCSSSGLLWCRCRRRRCCCRRRGHQCAVSRCGQLGDLSRREQRVGGGRYSHQLLHLLLLLLLQRHCRRVLLLLLRRLLLLLLVVGRCSCGSRRRRSCRLLLLLRCCR